MNGAPINLSKRGVSLQLAILGATSFVVTTIVLYYVFLGHDGLPLGWDTPYYIGGGLVVATQGPAALLIRQGPYDFVYQMFMGVLIWAGIPGTVVEIFLPIVLAGSITCLLTRLALVYLNRQAAIFVALATPSWSAVYRLQADLHANLLALTLFLSALILLSQARSIRDPRCISGIAIVALASFTHIESTLFLALVTLVSSISKLRPFPLKVALVMTVSVVPATLFFIAHVLQLLASSGGTLEFSSPQTLLSWITILGPVLPLTLIGLAWSSLRPKSWVEILVSVWAFASLAIGISQYFSLETVNFAQRAIILIPTPFLAGIGSYRIMQILGRIKIKRVQLRYAKSSAIAAIFIILVLSWPITSYSVAPDEKVFLTSAAYQHLLWLRANVKFSNTPIFMFNDVDQYAGGLAQLYDSWVSAEIGPHLSYLGLTDYLVRLEKTPYSDLDARTVGDIYLGQFQTAGITTRTLLLQHPILIMSDFYRPSPLPAYTATLFSEVSPGIFIGNVTRLASIANVTLPLYMIFGSHSGDWYGSPALWAESIDAYTVYDSVTPTIQASFLFQTLPGGTYTLGLRYLDANGNNFTIAVDGKPIGTIEHNNTNGPAFRYFAGISLSGGTHILMITVSNMPSVATRYVSLDYLVLSAS